MQVMVPLFMKLHVHGYLKVNTIIFFILDFHTSHGYLGAAGNESS